jgi:hypothetical protein
MKKIKCFLSKPYGGDLDRGRKKLKFSMMNKLSAMDIDPLNFNQPGALKS